MKERSGSFIQPRLMSRSQVANYLQCSEGTVDSLVADGLIPGPQPWRGLVRWDKVSIDAVIDRVYGRAATGDLQSIEAAIDARSPGVGEKKNAPEPEPLRVRVLPDGRMTRADAARYLGHTPKTLAMWQLQGKGPNSVLVGGRRFYYKDALDAFIRSA